MKLGTWVANIAIAWSLNSLSNALWPVPATQLKLFLDRKICFSDSSEV